MEGGQPMKGGPPAAKRRLFTKCHTVIRTWSFSLAGACEHGTEISCSMKWGGGENF
jgi:hypothetical protein